MGPRVEQLHLPAVYGNPTKIMSWDQVRAKLEISRSYWLASTRPDGRPHVVPRDGIWMGDRLYYGGSPTTVHESNVQKNPAVVASIGEGNEAVIVEGVAYKQKVSDEIAAQLASASSTKYPDYGSPDPSAYTGGVWVLEPKKVMAWTLLYEDATRFTFD